MARKTRWTSNQGPSALAALNSRLSGDTGRPVADEPLAEPAASKPDTDHASLSARDPDWSDADGPAGPDGDGWSEESDSREWSDSGEVSDRESRPAVDLRRVPVQDRPPVVLPAECERGPPRSVSARVRRSSVVVLSVRAVPPGDRSPWLAPGPSLPERLFVVRAGSVPPEADPERTWPSHAEQSTWCLT